MAQRGGQGARAGDSTGRERDRLMKEHADEIRAGAEALTTINPPGVAEPDGSVIDYTEGASDWDDTAPDAGGDGVRMLSLEDLAADPDVEMPGVLNEAEFDIDSLETGLTAPGDPELKVVSPDQPQPVRPGAARPVQEDEVPDPGTVRPGTPRGRAPKSAIIEQPEAVVARPKFKVLRVNEQLDDVTIGKGRNFSFKPGQYYKVEPDVYEHLDEKGLVYH